MPSAAGQYCDLVERIARWKQEVDIEVPQRENIRARHLHTYESSPRKLRPRPTRPALAEASGNPVRKRKAPTTGPVANTTKRRKMDGNPPRDKKGRGRPPKGKPPSTAADPDLPIGPESVPGSVPALESIPDLPPSSSSASTSKRTTSPSKRRQLTFNTVTSDTAIGINYLGLCNPAVIPALFSELQRQGQKISSSVLDLHKKLYDTPTGFIPSALRNAYDNEANTPRKSKESNLQSWYLDVEETPFPRRCLDRMKDTVENVLEKATRTYSQRAQERQWGQVVCQLLCEVEIWQQSPTEIISLNVESCSIAPVECRMKKPDGAALLNDDQSDAKSKTASDDIGRMIDWCLGMAVDSDDQALIRKAYQKSADMERSLNQSLSYIRNNPLILDIEIKKTFQPRDPEVQLAIWASAALLKKRHHKWDTSMPMPAIVVNGHNWHYYIFFELNEELRMAGPYPFGATDNLNGIWGILYRLHIIMTWGKREYKAWFEEQVMKPVREERLGG